jgi:hypothetical protein
LSIVQSVFDADGGHHDVLSRTTYVRRHAAMRLATCTTPARRRVTQSSSLASFARARLFCHGISVVAACTATKPTMRRAYTPRSGISAYHAGSRCSPRSWFSACHAGRGCSPRSCVSSCHEGRGCSPRTGASASRAGTGCTPRSRLSACHAGSRCSPRSCLSASHASTAYVLPSLREGARRGRARAKECRRFRANKRRGFSKTK